MKREWLILSYFLLYGVLLIWLLFFYADASFSRTAHTRLFPTNLVPFKTISHMYEFMQQYEGEKGTLWNFIKNVGGNIVLFIPLGLFLSYYFSKQRIFYLMVLIIGISVVVEWIQYLSQQGNADIDDVILNACGGALGIYLFHKIKVSTQNIV